MIYSTHANQNSYPFILPDLPFGREELMPYFTAETFDYHYEKHHQTYVTNLNKLLENNQELHGRSLEEIITLSYSKNHNIFNNASQIWNHSFFWHSLKPHGDNAPVGKILTQINKDFGSFENFSTEFRTAALNQFGSGWIWLVFARDKFEILQTSNADTPITQDIQPILVCDVWEHAYYIDYRNKRLDYVSAYIKHMINWEFAVFNYEKISQLAII